MRARIRFQARIPGLLALVALAAIFTSGVPVHAGPALPAVRTHLARYEGRLAEDARFDRVFGDLEGEVRRALVVIEDRLGLTPVDPARIHVHVRDADLRRYGRDRARCTTQEHGGATSEHVELFAEYFVSGDSDLRTVITHELVHAVMRQRAGPEVYARLPHWVREGLAVHAADEGGLHLRRTLTAHEEVDALLTGLMTSKRDVVMYPYAWLAIELLAERGGATAIERFARGTTGGKDPRKLAARICGTSWPGFRAALRRFARGRVRAAAAGLADIQAARALYRGKRWSEARGAFERFLREHPASAFAATARYYAARCWFRQRRFAQAAEGFRACIRRDLGASGWIDECHLYLGLARLELERHEAARRTLRDYVEFHPYAGHRDLGYLALGRTLTRLGREAEARAAFERVARIRGARGTHKAAAARELRALDEAS